MLTLEIPHSNLYEYIHSVVNFLSSIAPQHRKLQDTQVELLSRLLTQDEKYKYFPFSIQARKALIAKHYPTLKLRLLNARIENLRRKGYLTRKEDNELYFNPHLLKIRSSYPKFSFNVVFSQKENTQS